MTVQRVKEELKRFLSERGIELSSDQVKLLDFYRMLILDWSERINIVSKGDVERLEEIHFADSIAPQSLIPEGSKVADWGSGGGLPGIPLAIARPDIHVTLIESRHNKAAFLNKASKELGLKNLALFPERGERLDESFEVITVRAVGRIKELLPLIASYLEAKGMTLFYKGTDVDSEMDEAKKLSERMALSIRQEEVVLPSGRTSKYILFCK